MKYAKGDLLQLAEDGQFDVVVHGCNCFNTMGGGIARQIREQYPAACAADLETKKGDYNKLGNYTLWLGPKFTIVNAYTQYGMSRGEDVFEYASFLLILLKLKFHYANAPTRFGFPMIGMGLAGGHKESIIEMLRAFSDRVEEINPKSSVTLVEFAQ